MLDGRIKPLNSGTFYTSTFSYPGGALLVSIRVPYMCYNIFQGWPLNRLTDGLWPS